ncbi:MAG TPA: DUF2058 domain-containing protein [Steroidobacteraceae bacterium]|nr:DUF2058 domain-containing protein [Steroidobacteraceae bacterium]
MSMSLRDQLLAAGLGTKKQAKAASQAKRPPPRHQPPPVSPEKLAAAKAAAAKAARDTELNRRLQEKQAAKARRTEIKQLIEQHRLPPVESDEYFNFADGNRLARLPVTPVLREQLIKGTVAVVRYEGHYAVVPEAIIARIKERDEHAVVTQTTQASQGTVDANDPYKDFVVPDDLTW